MLPSEPAQRVQVDVLKVVKRESTLCLLRGTSEPYIASAFFSGTLYSRGLKFLQVIYRSFDCDLTQDFLNSGLELKCLYRERLSLLSIYYRRRQSYCVTWRQQRYAEVQSC